jgi:hypothetical protein
MQSEIFCVIFTSVDSHNGIKEIGTAFLDLDEDTLMTKEFFGTISDTMIGVVTRSSYRLEVAESMENVVNYLRDYLCWRSDQHQQNLIIFYEKSDLGALTVFRNLIKALPYCKWKNPCNITLANLNNQEITEDRANNAETVLKKVQKDRYSAHFRTITLSALQ